MYCKMALFSLFIRRNLALWLLISVMSTALLAQGGYASGF